MKYLFFTIYFAWASLSGIVEAILYSGMGSRALKINEHIIFTLQRIAVIFLALIGIYIGHIHKYYNFHDGVTAIIVIVCSFSFFHNGFYYIARHKIDSPHYGFFSNSSTSTAFLELNSITRTILFVISLIAIIAI